jgi:archaellum component FlaF (FlaF/FlaG flagellin family)
METAIASLILLVVMVLSMLGLSMQSMTAQAAIMQATQVMQQRESDQAHTSLTPLAAEVTPLGDYVQVTLKNTGSTKLADFNQWDVILHYTDALGSEQLAWFAYPAQWTAQIYQVATGTPEVFDPGILNPGEEVVVMIGVPSLVGSGTVNQVTIGTPNGVTASTIFTR